MQPKGQKSMKNFDIRANKKSPISVEIGRCEQMFKETNMKWGKAYKGWFLART